MPANFTQGWFGNGQPAWHGQGVVTEGTLPAREAFATADALFEVEKRQLSYPVHGDEGQVIKFQPADIYGLVRKDTDNFLGAVSERYQIVQNTSLLRMAEFIREEANLESVVVLEGGAKVAFSAALRGASADIVAGDTVKRRLVGYLGHDGKTGLGAIFTNIRVVCSNTLAGALKDNGAKTSITHKGDAESKFDKLIRSIDISRQSFTAECSYMRELATREITPDLFREFVDRVYEVKEGDVFRKRQKLERAFRYGMGASFAPNTIWNAVNAVTEVETSPLNKTAVNARKMFKSANFGAGLNYSKRASTVARELVGI